MAHDQLMRLAEQFLAGKMPVAEFLQQVDLTKSARLRAAELDVDRTRRCGYPEVVFGEGKTTAALVEIAKRQRDEGTPVLITRIEAAAAAAVVREFPTAVHNATARTLRIGQQPGSTLGRVAVVTAGTSDLPVAQEAEETLRWMRVEVDMIQDVGVAGPHRLPNHLDTLRAADAIVVVAGMEGALPSVVGGYVGTPVFAVPTSVGYGASFGGLAALLGMLNSCAANVAVVNIDAGFKGAYLAGLIARDKHQAAAVHSSSSAADNQEACATELP